MLFSIITVTYNAEATIQPTLDSVASQTFSDFEYLIIDGASTDHTVERATASGISQMRITSQPDRGLYDAMNHGLNAAKGDYVIFLNAGDSFTSADVLQCYADAIMANDRPGMVYGQTRLVDAERRYVGPRHLTAPRHLTLRSFAQGMLVCHQAMAVRRDITGQYSMNYRYSADYEWVINVLKRSQHNVYVDRTVIDYLNEGVTTANHKNSLRERYHIMCDTYGTVPTMLRHVGFALRNLKRKYIK
jgi:glycosyltransferase involved in cell wall biosynthesis